MTIMPPTPSITCKTVWLHTKSPVSRAEKDPEVTAGISSVLIGLLWQRERDTETQRERGRVSSGVCVCMCLCMCNLGDCSHPVMSDRLDKSWPSVTQNIPLHHFIIWFQGKYQRVSEEMQLGYSGVDQTLARPLRCSRCNGGGSLNALLVCIFTLYTCTTCDSFAKFKPKNA